MAARRSTTAAGASTSCVADSPTSTAMSATGPTALELHLQLTAGRQLRSARRRLRRSSFFRTTGAASTPFRRPITTSSRCSASTAIYASSNTLSFQGGLYFRAFNQAHVDGNTTDVASCPPFSCLNGNPVHRHARRDHPRLSRGRHIRPGRDRPLVDAVAFGRRESRRRSTPTSSTATTTSSPSAPRSTTAGRISTATANSGLIASTDNSFPVIGRRLHSRRARQLSRSGLGPGHQPLRRPLRARHVQRHDCLALTGGSASNYAAIDLKDQTGGLVNGDSTYSRINPVLGLTYKITPDDFRSTPATRMPTARRPRSNSAAPIPTIPASSTTSWSLIRIFSRSSREHSRPASAEISPCSTASCSGRPACSAPRSSNDILPLQSSANGFGYYANVGTTLRQGAELSANWRNDRWTVYANYTYIDAVYRIDLPGAVAVQSGCRRERPHSDHARDADRRHSAQHGQGRRRLRADRQLEDRRGYGRGQQPDNLRKRERRASSRTGLRDLQPPHFLSGRASSFRSMVSSRTSSIRTIIRRADCST